MDNKCEDCPLGIWKLDKGESYYTIPGEYGCEYDEDDCRLTPASFDRIRAERAGKWRCETCGVWDCSNRCQDIPCRDWEKETDLQAWFKAESKWIKETTCSICQGAGGLVEWSIDGTKPVKGGPWECPACGGTSKRQPRKDDEDESIN